MLLNSPLFSTSFSNFPTILVFSLPHGNSPIFSLPQKGEKSDPSNYRPIAITSLISNTMETIITKQLLALLETNSLLSDHQYGCQQASSTGDLLAYAVHTWSSALESYGESRVISLDIFKAFDRIFQKGLLAKLSIFGLHHTLIDSSFSGLLLSCLGWCSLIFSPSS